MLIALLIAGIGFLLAGLLGVAFGIPVKEFSFGNTEILAGVITACTGAIMLGLWLVIVAAEMLVGGTGIGYFVWNQWNNLSIANVIFAVLLIGVIGMVLDMAFARIQKKVTYVE